MVRLRQLREDAVCELTSLHGCLGCCYMLTHPPGNAVIAGHPLSCVCNKIYVLAMPDPASGQGANAGNQFRSAGLLVQLRSRIRFVLPRLSNLCLNDHDYSSARQPPVHTCTPRALPHRIR